MEQSDLAEASAASSFVLIAGIGEYRDSRIPRLNYVHADAEAFAELLTDRKRVGVPSDNVKMLLDSDATLYHLKNAISGWLFRHAGPDSTVIIFFAGHGGVESDKTGGERDGIAKYLLPWDADVDNLFASALSNSEFNWLLSTIKARRLVIFMDACYAGGVSRRGARDLGIVDDPCQRLAQGEGRVVIAAAQPNQRSFEDPSLGHGIFTHHLLEALRGQADWDEDGLVSIWEVYKYLEREVPRTARRLAQGIQEPVLCGDISRDIVLTADAERLARAHAQASAAERQRQEEIKQKRSTLFDLFNGGKLGLDAYQQALKIVETPESDLSGIERDLKEFLEAMLRGALSPERYTQTRTLLLMQNVPPVNLQDQPDSKPPAQTLSFCIRCGARLLPGNLFCVKCGQKIR